MPNKKQALVVSDDSVLRQEISSVLDGIGFKVTAIADVADTRETLGSRQYEVAVMGESLPDMDWRSTVRTVKLASKTTRVLMVARQAPAEDLRSALSAGAYVVLDRPMTQEQITDIIGLQKDGLFVVLRG